MKQRMLSTLLTLALGLALSVPASAGFDEGVAAHEGGDYAKALVEFSPLAKQGEAAAQFALGVMYANGQGVTQDYQAALAWFRKSAEQGNADAQYNLGVMYAKGLGVAKDCQVAVVFFRKAAVQGQADAQFNLGVMYRKGLGVAQDNVVAYALCKLSAANNASSSNADIINCGALAEDSSPAQIETAQDLTR
jgi:TPR repeat protein